MIEQRHVPARQAGSIHVKRLRNHLCRTQQVPFGNPKEITGNGFRRTCEQTGGVMTANAALDKLDEKADKATVLGFRSAREG